MLQILQEFEQTAARFSPVVLIAPGVVAVIIGLFIWLGGLGFKKVLVVILGAVAGWLCGFFIGARNGACPSDTFGLNDSRFSMIEMLGSGSQKYGALINLKGEKCEIWTDDNKSSKKVPWVRSNR